MKRGGPLKRRTPLRARSAKRTAEAVERRALVADVLRRRPLCEARQLWLDARAHVPLTDSDKLECIAAGCTRLAVDLHEPLTRARGGDPNDEAATLPVCRWCHSRIHAEPLLATAAGLLVPSWDRPT